MLHLRANDFDGSERADLDLLFVVGKCLVRKSERALFYLHVLVCVDEIPINILDLVDGCNDLQAKGHVRYFAVVPRDADKAQVRPKSKTLQQLLMITARKLEFKRGLKLGEGLSL